MVILAAEILVVVAALIVFRSAAAAEASVTVIEYALPEPVRVLRAAIPPSEMEAVITPLVAPSIMFASAAEMPPVMVTALLFIPVI